MRRLVRQATTFFALLFIVTLVQLPYGSYRSTILPRLRSTLTPQNISIDLEESLLRFPATLALTKLALLFPAGKVPVPFVVESADITLRLLPLLWLTARSDLEGKLYSGELTGTVSRSLISPAIGGEIDIRSLKLGEHPFLNAAGVQGNASLKFKLRSQGSLEKLNALDEAELTVSINGGTIADSGYISPLIHLPFIHDVTGRAVARLYQKKLIIDTFELSSSVGSVRGGGAFTLDDRGKAQSGGLRLDVVLTDEGRVPIGGYLALAARVPVENPAKEWVVDIGTDSAGRGKASVRPK